MQQLWKCSQYCCSVSQPTKNQDFKNQWTIQITHNKNIQNWKLYASPSSLSSPFLVLFLLTYSFFPSFVNIKQQIVCGDVFVGKTQLVRQLLAMPYQPQYYATFGINLPILPLPLTPFLHPFTLNPHWRLRGAGLDKENARSFYLSSLILFPFAPRSPSFSPRFPSFSPHTTLQIPKCTNTKP